jgi:S1-C subfamily serine protease
VIAARLIAALASAAVLGALATGGAGAAGVSPVPGIVDIYTNLGYQQAAAAGTGIVLTSSGVVLTNNHVIRGATTIKVVDLDNGHTYKATVLGYTINGDVAAIQMTNASNLNTAPLGHSAGLHVGQAVTTYGNAGGAGGAPSAASGKIVGLGKSITARDDSGNSEQLTNLIATDASLEPGDSGGPMVDANGQVIAMDTAAGSSFTFESSVSRGYAVPIDRAAAIVAQIVAGRASTAIHVGRTAFMGIQVGGTDPFAGQLSSGILVASVVPGSPVSKIGLNPGDVLTRFDGKAVNSQTGLTALILARTPGESVPIRWYDQFGTAHTASVTLASGPPQ